MTTLDAALLAELRRTEAAFRREPESEALHRAWIRARRDFTAVVARRGPVDDWWAMKRYVIGHYDQLRQLNVEHIPIGVLVHA